MFGAETSPHLLEELLTKFKEHHQSVQTLLLKQEYQRSQAMMRQKMLENLDESLQKQAQVKISVTLLTLFLVLYYFSNS